MMLTLGDLPHKWIRRIEEGNWKEGPIDRDIRFAMMLKKLVQEATNDSRDSGNGGEDSRGTILTHYRTNGVSSLTSYNILFSALNFGFPIETDTIHHQFYRFL